MNARQPSILEQPGHAVVFWWLVFAGPGLVVAATAVAGGVGGKEAALYAFFLGMFAYIAGVGAVLSEKADFRTFLTVLLIAVIVSAGLALGLFLVHRLPLDDADVTTTTLGA